MNELNNIQSKISKSSRVISIVLQICSIAVIVAFCMEAITLVWIGATGSVGEAFKLGAISLHSPVDSDAGTAQIAVEAVTAMTQQIFVWFMIFAACRIFKEISVELRPFELKHAARIRKIAILMLVSGVVVPAAEAIAARLCDYTGAVSGEINMLYIFVGIIFLALSYMFRYGAMLQQQADETL